MLANKLFTGASQNFLTNMLGFNLIWALSIFLGNPAVPAVLALLLLHFLYHRDLQAEMHVVLITGLLGYAVDCSLALAGVFVFTEVQGITPLWLLFLWFGFCATLRQSLAFFTRYFWLSIPAGAIFGSFAYLAAERFGAVSFGLPWFDSAILIAAIWALLFPLLLWLSQVVGEYTCPTN